MRTTAFVALLMALLLVSAGFAPGATTRRPTTRKVVSKKSVKPAASSAKKTVTPAKKKTSVSSRSTSRKKTASRRTPVRRSSPPRQSQPSPERYMEIQQALVERGYSNSPVDGKWDAEWTVALKRFQAEQHLNPDGKLGSLSLIALGLGPKRQPLPEQFQSNPEPVN